MKKFAQERQYENGAQAYLFRDNDDRCLQVLWLDGTRKDAFVPLEVEGRVQLIHIDGSRQELHPIGGGVTLTFSDDPVMLLYEQEDAQLAEMLDEPHLALASEQIDSVSAGKSITLSLEGKRASAEALQVVAPPLWKFVVKQTKEHRVDLTLVAPPTTAARQARVRIQSLANGNVADELSVAIAIGDE